MSDVATPETAAFWREAAAGRFMLPRCGVCGRTHWYPRAVCPHCMGDVGTWFEAAGTGTIYSFSVMRRAKPVYAIAYVRLAEGPVMLTNLVDCDYDALRIGQVVGLRWRLDEGGRNVPCFAPIVDIAGQPPV